MLEPNLLGFFLTKHVSWGQWNHMVGPATESVNLSHPHSASKLVIASFKSS